MDDARDSAGLLLEDTLSDPDPAAALHTAAALAATSHPDTWEDQIQLIGHRLHHPDQHVRQALLDAVRAWHNDPHAVLTEQLQQAKRLGDRLNRRQEHPETEQRQAATHRADPMHTWAENASRIDPRLPHQPDWPALAHTLQRLHDQGHDVNQLLQQAIATEPRLGRAPAQELRYRLVRHGPEPAPIAPATTPSTPRDTEHEKRPALTPGHTSHAPRL